MFSFLLQDLLFLFPSETSFHMIYAFFPLLFCLEPACYRDDNGAAEQRNGFLRRSRSICFDVPAALLRVYRTFSSLQEIKELFNGLLVKKSAFLHGFEATGTQTCSTGA